MCCWRLLLVFLSVHHSSETNILLMLTEILTTTITLEGAFVSLVLWSYLIWPHYLTWPHYIWTEWTVKQWGSGILHSAPHGTSNLVPSAHRSPPSQNPNMPLQHGLPWLWPVDKTARPSSFWLTAATANWVALQCIRCRLIWLRWGQMRQGTVIWTLL